MMKNESSMKWSKTVEALNSPAPDSMQEAYPQYYDLSPIERQAAVLETIKECLPAKKT
jgi:hypothetical protein